MLCPKSAFPSRLALLMRCLSFVFDQRLCPNQQLLLRVDQRWVVHQHPAQRVFDDNTDDLRGAEGAS